MNNSTLGLDTYVKTDELIRIGKRAVRRAQEENRQKGVPNVYAINGIIYYELSNGELSRTDPQRFLDSSELVRPHERISDSSTPTKAD